VRHIVGAQQWDSFAKAAWVVHTLEESELSLGDIKRMIGDDQSFTDRIVEGYYFVQQIRNMNAYDPADSLRRGRGSLQEFPFSWVYTALGYKNVRAYLGLPAQTVINLDPVDSEHLENAGFLMQCMFGGAGKNAAIEDSRQIGSLAKALANEDAVEILIQGGSIMEALDATRPPDVRLSEILTRADRTIADGVKVASGLPPLDHDKWREIHNSAYAVANRVDSLIAVIENLKPTSRKSVRRGK